MPRLFFSFGFAFILGLGCGSLVSELDRIQQKASATSAVPTFSPAPDAYYSAQNVTLLAAPAGTLICYTVNGADPACSDGSCTAGLAYSTAVTTVSTAGASVQTTIRAVACEKGARSSSVATSTYTIDRTAPVLLSSNPTNAATSVSPCGSSVFSNGGCTAAITLVFNKRMDTTQTQALTLDVHDGTSFVNATVSLSSAVWSTTNMTNDTLALTPSWLLFPENTEVRYSLPAAGFQDIGGTVIAAGIQRTFTTATLGVSYPVSDTGVGICYNAASVQACPNVAGFPNQDGDFPTTPNGRSFLGPNPHATYTSDYTTLDNVTGLTWKSCIEGLSGVLCGLGTNSTMSWYNALNQCAAMNAANAGAGYAGRTNWRLPTNVEMETLPDYSLFNPAYPAAHFPATSAQYYWSSTTMLNSPMDVFSQYGASGLTAAGVGDKTSVFRVRCVSQGTVAKVASFTDNNDGTITDLNTDLMWTKCSMNNSGTGTLQTYTSGCTNLAAGTRNWSQALTDCTNLVLAGKSWRLPNKNELKSIVDKSVTNPTVRAAYFPNTTASSYWTSSTFANNTANAWVVQFSNGGTLDATKSGVSNFVRCVANRF